MKPSHARFWLRSAVICFSLSLLLGCVWLAQKQANPAVMPGSKSGTLIMSGSKSFTGGTTVAGDALKTSQPKPH